MSVCTGIYITMPHSTSETISRTIPHSKVSTIIRKNESNFGNRLLIQFLKTKPMTNFSKQLLFIIVVSLILAFFGIGISSTFISNFTISVYSLLAIATVFNLNEFLTRENKPTLTIMVENTGNDLI